jgi:hypothetical protein
MLSCVDGVGVGVGEGENLGTGKSQFSMEGADLFLLDDVAFFFEAVLGTYRERQGRVPGEEGVMAIST